MTGGPRGVAEEKTTTPDGREEHVVLVDEHDVPTGTLGKLAAHGGGGVRHRAVSVMLFRDDGAVLLQRRAPGKYHSPGLWSNTACGHPRPGEAAVDAARRRLADELGIDAALELATTFEYRAALDGGLVEHEIDHVFVGRTDAEPAPDPSEVDAWRWVMPDALAGEMAAEPARYTAWCPLVWRALVEAGAVRDGR